MNPLSDYAALPPAWESVPNVGHLRNFTTSQYENHSLSYTKNSSDKNVTIPTNRMAFVVCPHAYYHGSGVCEDYVAGP